MNITVATRQRQRLWLTARYVASLAGAAALGSLLLGTAFWQDGQRARAVNSGVAAPVIRQTPRQVYHFYIVRTEDEAKGVLAANDEGALIHLSDPQ